jgi:hypothetical protein
MRLRKRCAAWLGLAGACLFAIGCGGSDIPDPGSDANAAGGNPPGAGGGGPEPGGGAPAPVVAAAEAPQADAAAPAPTPPAAGKEGEAPKEQSKGNSTTNEMLALSGGANPPAGGNESPKQPEPGAPPAGGANPGSPPAGGAPNSGSSDPRARGGASGPGQMAPGVGGGGPPRMGPGSPGMAPGSQQADPAKLMAGMQKTMQDQMKAMGAAGGQKQPGAGGAGGGAAVDDSPADLHSPVGAVRTFLSALKAKDADRLSEATARRAAIESSGKNQEMFSKILEVTLSDSEIDDLAKKLEGYQVAGENPPKSTGRVDVVIQKSDGGGAYSRRRVTARHEKKGWGVLDIGPEQVFKSLGSRGRTYKK